MRYPENSPCKDSRVGGVHSRYIDVEDVLWAAVTAGFPLGSEDGDGDDGEDDEHLDGWHVVDGGSAFWKIEIFIGFLLPLIWE